MGSGASGNVARDIDDRLREFMRGEIDYHALLIALVRIFDADPSARATALELIDRQEPPGALQRGFMRVLKERIEQELAPAAPALTSSPPPDVTVQAPITGMLSIEAAVAPTPEAEGPVLDETPTIPVFAQRGPRDERFVARRRVAPPPRRGRGEDARRPPPPPAPVANVGWVAPATPEWSPAHVVPTRTAEDGLAGDVRVRKRSHTLLWFVGLGLIAFALTAPMQEQLARLTAVYEEVPAAFRPAPGPTPAAPTTSPSRAAEEVAATPAPVSVAPAAPPPQAIENAPAADPAPSPAPNRATATQDPAPARETLAAAPAAPPPTPAPAPGPGRLGFATDAYRVSESDAMVALTIERTGGSAGPVSIAWWARPGSAHAEEDYADLGHRVESFAPGETTRQIYVPIVSDAVFEESEAFAVYVADPEDGAKLGAITSVTVTIADDDR